MGSPRYDNATDFGSEQPLLRELSPSRAPAARRGSGRSAFDLIAEIDIAMQFHRTLPLDLSRKRSRDVSVRGSLANRRTPIRSSEPGTSGALLYRIEVLENGPDNMSELIIWTYDWCPKVPVALSAI